MKNLLASLAVTGLLLGGISAFAADKEETIKGEAQCAKCSLKKADKCTNVVVVKEEGKEPVMFYLADNEETKKDGGFHKKVCQKVVKIKATGTVTEKDGKKEFAAKKIEIVEDKK